jgi:hypothetical protein
MVCKLSSKDTSTILFRVGSIGYVAGFLAWFTWLVLVILNLAFYSLGNNSSILGMSGIFFQSWIYSAIVYSFFLASFILCSFACFGLKKRYDSNIALMCGLFYFVIFAVLCYSIVSAYLLGLNIWIDANFLTFFNLGMLFWGATLLGVRKFLPSPKLSVCVGSIFIVTAILTLTLFLQMLLYWGVEFWFMLFGWLYAIGTIGTAIILYRLSK